MQFYTDYTLYCFAQKPVRGTDKLLPRHVNTYAKINNMFTYQSMMKAGSQLMYKYFFSYYQQAFVEVGCFPYDRP